MTEGMKTSEFYFAIVQFVIGLVMLITGVVKGNQENIDKGTTLIMSAVAAYSVARGLKKLTVPGSVPDSASSNVDAVANAKGK